MIESNEKPIIYIAAPLFNSEERARNKKIAVELHSRFNVFLPQEDGLLLHKLVENGVPIKDAENSVFESDIAAMRRSDIILAILDGASIDEGVAFELGFCRALNKICVGLQTDIRRQLPTGNNPMIGCSCEFVFNEFRLLKEWLITKLSHDLTLTNSSTRTHFRSPVN